MVDSNNSSHDFTRKVLPWLVAAAALVLYGATMSHWVTLSSLHLVSKVTGWDWWTPTVERPLFLLVTLPLRLLPVGAQLIALNFFSVVCAALTLGLLARSVGLLPHDRTREQRQLERSNYSLLTVRGHWVPPLLAALICGLQLTFWDHATSATGEALDILLFAYVIRCLLEFRVSQDEKWITRLALVYGLATTDNWAMLGFFPFFLVALIWIKGRSFFEFRFITRTAGFGLLGLLPYLWLPLMNGSGEGFLETLRMEFGGQKNFLLYFPKGTVIVLALISVLPALLIVIRWPSTAGETNVAAGLLASFMFRVAHVALLVAILWTSFDPEFSPRARGFGVPFLTFYYLGALAAGYYSGYLLLIFGPGSSNAWNRPSKLLQLVGGVITVAIFAATVAVPAALVNRNLPVIHAERGPALHNYASQLIKSVGTSNALVFGTTPQRLLLFSAALESTNAPTLVDMFSLSQPKYYLRLQQRHSSQLPTLNSSFPLTNSFSPVVISQLLDYLARTNQIYFLDAVYGHPLLEIDYLEPHGLAFSLKPYSTNYLASPLVAPELAAVNQSFWLATATNLTSVKADRSRHDTDASVLGIFYSAALNIWAVELQKLGRHQEAGAWFDKAVELYPQNTVAILNRDFNKSLPAGLTTTNAGTDTADYQLGDYRTWNNLLTALGPIAEPKTCYRLGVALAQSKLMRQAALQFLHAQNLAPASPAPRLALGEVLLFTGRNAELLTVVKEARSLPAFRNLGMDDDFAFTRLEAFGLLKTDAQRAERLLLEASIKYPKDVTVLENLTEAYLQTGRLTNALETAERALKISPDYLPSLLNQGAILVEFKQFDRALPVLNHLLRLHPNHLAGLLQHASANMGISNLAAAERDYHQALDLWPNLPAALFGLGEVAQKQNRIPEAIKQYEACLLQVPTNSPFGRQITERLTELKSRK